MLSAQKLLFSTMVFIGIEGKLHYMPNKAKLLALENVVQTPPNGPFDHEDLLGEVVIWHIGMQQGPCLIEVAFIPTIWVLDFIVGETFEGQGAGRCRFLCKKHIIHLDNNLQQSWIDTTFEFLTFKF